MCLIRNGSLERGESMNVDVELRREVFAWFGAAAYHAQCVEAELILHDCASLVGGTQSPPPRRGKLLRPKSGQWATCFSPVQPSSVR